MSFFFSPSIISNFLYLWLCVYCICRVVYIPRGCLRPPNIVPDLSLLGVFFLSASRDQGGREWFPQKRAHKIFSLSIEMLDWWDKYWQSWFSISCYCCKRRRIHTKGTVSRVWREADGQFSLFLNINSFCVFLISADSLTVRKESFEKSYWVNIVFVVWELSPASGNSTSVYMIPVRSPLPTSSAAGADVSGGYQCDGTRRPAGFVKRLSLSLFRVYTGEEDRHYRCCLQNVKEESKYTHKLSFLANSATRLQRSVKLHWSTSSTLSSFVQ